MTNKNTLITGGTGRLGKELVKVFPDSIRPTRGELDLLNQSSVSQHIERSKPKIVIHCAALTGIAQCENNQVQAWNVNVRGTEWLIRACEKFVRDCYFVYVSTPCVFRGDKGDYSEIDIPYPKNFYGLTKLIAEFVVKHSNLKTWLIARTNFVAREKWPYQKAFVDRFGTYLFADEVAMAMVPLIKQRLTGVVHIAGNEKLSMFELAKITDSDVKAITIADYNGPPLTMDMSLQSNRISPFSLRRQKNG